MPQLDTLIAGNTIQAWIVAAAVAIAVFAGLRVLHAVVVRQLRAFAARTRTDIDAIIVDALGRTRVFFFAFLAFYAALQVVNLPGPAARGVRYVGVLVIILQVGIWGNALIGAIITRRSARLLEEDAASATTLSAVGFIARLAFWVMLLLLGLQNVGIEITPLLTGLGIGGIAIALAVQNILGDLFASLSIVVDKPFVVGDFIIVDELLGTVEHVGLKTTRVRSLSGEQLVFANSDLLNARIRNFKRMYHRRVVFSFGVTYQTPYEKAARIAGIVREIIEAQPRTRFDRAHFREFGDFSLNYEVVYHVLDPDFNVHADIQQAINLELLRRLQQEGIEFAYPTQTLFVQSQPTA